MARREQFPLPREWTRIVRSSVLHAVFKFMDARRHLPIVELKRVA